MGNQLKINVLYKVPFIACPDTSREDLGAELYRLDYFHVPSARLQQVIAGRHNHCNIQNALQPILYVQMVLYRYRIKQES